MKAQVKTLDNKAAGEIELNDAIFGVDVRRDLLTRMVNWQLAKRRAGTHKTKGISEISGTTAKPYSQKGTGRARQGSLRSPQFRKGAVIFGPLPRDYEYSMPKKVRQLALKSALAAKAQSGQLLILDAAKSSSAKTKTLAVQLAKLGLSKALIIDGANLDENFAKSARNIPHINVLPEQGANVYDILRAEHLVLTKNAVEQLQQRLLGDASTAGE